MNSTFFGKKFSESLKTPLKSRSVAFSEAQSNAELQHIGQQYASTGKTLKIVETSSFHDTCSIEGLAAI